MGSTEDRQHLAEATASSEPVPLVIDVDGTLLRTDLLLESACRFVGQAPQNAFLLLLWILGGKAALKAHIAERVAILPESLPFNPSVLEFVSREKTKGRPVYLASASDHRYVQSVADHLGYVDGVFASDGDLNLAGSAKARRLVDVFGSNGFDYIGNERRDLQVWRNARIALVVDASESVERAVVDTHPNPIVLSSHRPGWLTYLRAIRPHQWLKNLLIFLPLVADHRFEIENVTAALIAFFAFSFCASGLYVLNDLLDLPHDRQHTRKRNRPFANGTVPIMHGLVAAPALVALGFALGATLPLEFLGMLALYFIATTAYSVYFKRKMLIDVLILAGLYTVRVLAGSAVIDVVVLSPWLLGFSLFIFLALAIVKRQTELVGRLREKKGDPSGRGYRTEDLTVLSGLAAAGGFSAVVVFALYINSDRVTTLYQSPEYLWLICPLLIYWIGRVLILSQRGDLHDDPVVFAVQDRVSLLTGALVVAVLLVAA